MVLKVKCDRCGSEWPLDRSWLIKAPSLPERVCTLCVVAAYRAALVRRTPFHLGVVRQGTTSTYVPEWSNASHPSSE